jgi:hypothetical protein
MTYALFSPYVERRWQEDKQMKGCENTEYNIYALRGKVEKLVL